MEVARVHVRSWQAGYRGLLPDAYLDGLRALAIVFMLAAAAFVFSFRTTPVFATIRPLSLFIEPPWRIQLQRFSPSLWRRPPPPQN